MPSVLAAQRLIAAPSARPQPAPGPRLWLVLPVLAVSVGVLLLACMLPAFYALGSNPPGRAQLIAEYLLLASVGAAAWCIGASLRDRPRPSLHHPLLVGAALVVLVGLLVLGPLRTAAQSLSEIGAARTYAARWDDLDQQVRAQRAEGIRSVTVPPLASTGSVRNLDFVGPDRNDWFNQCVAGYYRINSIAASPSG